MSDADEMRALLAYANYAKVGRALDVTKATVSKWAKGEGVNPRRLEQVRNLIRPLEPEPVPQWVERVLAGLMAVEGRQHVTDAELAETTARAAAYLAAPRRTPRVPTGGGAGDEAAA